MKFLTKFTLALVLPVFAPAEPFPPLVPVAEVKAQRTNFGVRVAPGAGSVRAEAKGSFACTVASVTDGDTFRCVDGTRIRLSAIDTAEMPGSCRAGRNCAPGNPYAAKAALARLISGRTVQCRPVGMSYNRVAAWCSVGGQDLSCAMISNGHAIRLPRFDPSERLNRCR